MIFDGFLWKLTLLTKSLDLFRFEMTPFLRYLLSRYFLENILRREF